MRVKATTISARMGVNEKQMVGLYYPCSYPVSYNPYAFEPEWYPLCKINLEYNPNIWPLVCLSIHPQNLCIAR